jgi:quercetin dioxygenase-like cupin family protein
MLEVSNFDAPQETMDFPNGHAEVVSVGEARLWRVTFEPGFRWTKDMAPGADTATCPVRHVLHVLSGRLGLRLSDGSERELGPGDVANVPPDHDSWTVGDEPVRFLDVNPGR